jgi:hypothetical protein
MRYFRVPATSVPFFFCLASDKMADTAHLSPLQLADFRDLPRAGNLDPP